MDGFAFVVFRLEVPESLASRGEFADTAHYWESQGRLEKIIQMRCVFISAVT